MSGGGAGYKHKVEVLNKSAVVLLVATWESYIEELAENSFNFLISNCYESTNIPKVVRVMSTKKLRESKNDLDIWKLADDGWVSVLESHKDSVIKKYISTLNTPRTSNIDEIFSSLLGIKKLSSNWYWGGMSAKNASSKLEELITIRGEIAHTVGVSKSIKKSKVIDYARFLNRLATISSNRCTTHLHGLCGEWAWTTYVYGKTR